MVTTALIKERWTGRVNELLLGSGPVAVKTGGDSTLPFHLFEGEMPGPPVLALEVWDIEPGEWPEYLASSLGEAARDPAAWAQRARESGADLVCLRLAGSHPDNGDAGPEQCARVAAAVAGAVDLPMLVVGSDVEEKDAVVIPAVAEALRGRNCLLGCATPENYKTITAACMVNGHNIIASSPLDINLAKQLNILITEMGLAPDRIAMDPLVGALGYGIEYAYSIMERCRLGALTGDRMLSMPLVCFVGQEAWKTKEARSSVQDSPEWGEQDRRALLWEVITATTLAQAGGSILVIRHPESLKQIKTHFETMMKV